MGFFSKSSGIILPKIDLKGEIKAGSGSSFGRSSSVSFDRLKKSIDNAFATPDAKAILLDINSPGGSPAQSEAIASYIREKADTQKIPVYAFVQDMAASGGYWLACAADEIYALKTSMVGSIGVVSASFGMNKAIEKIGVERRIYTAGTSKAKLDPFSPENPSDVKWLKNLQENMHGLFKEWVLTRRDGKIAADPERLFNGDVWLGREALDLGLIDGIGSMRSVLAHKFPGQTLDIKEIRTRTSPLKALFNMESGFALPDLAYDIGRSFAGGILDGAQASVSTQSVPQVRRAA